MAEPNGEFGRSVAKDGRLTIVGAPGALQEANVPNTISGAVWVYAHEERDYVEHRILPFDDELTASELGLDVDVSGDLFVVGARFHEIGAGNNSHGAIYVGEYVDAVTPPNQTRLLATNPVNDGWFGDAVAIDGTTIVATEPGTQSVYVCEYDRATNQCPWVALPNAVGAGANSVDIHGNYIAVGQKGYGVPGITTNRGRVLIYERSNGVWALDDTIFIPAEFNENNVYFGSSVALSNGRLAVGAPKANLPDGSGRVFVYTRTGPQTWTQQGDEIALPTPGQWQYFGASVAIDGRRLVATGAGTADAAFVFKDVDGNGTWALEQAFTPIIDSADSSFGRSSMVALDSQDIIVGRATSDVTGQRDAGGVVFIETRKPITDIYLTSTDVNEGSRAEAIAELTAMDVSRGELWTYEVTTANSPFEAVGDELQTRADANIKFALTPTIDVTIRATDSEGSQYDKAVTLNVNDVAIAPQVTSDAVTAATEDAAYDYLITADDDDAIANLRFTGNIPAWLTLTDNLDGTANLSGIPTNDNLGQYAVTVTVADANGAGLSSDQQFTLTVTNTNDAPRVCRVQ